ncbi:class I SAM-dependent methyltransferase [Kribbella qitaiheensis]|uniref:class I SAM-dependent methyltransferase n=1 Tax=Kribbella qitaiheensis TaxID=1544730 RepID=UPI00361808CD
MSDVKWIDPGNADQLRAWDTAEGVFWAEEAELFEHALHRYDDALLRAAGIRDGDQVLDLGCGTGSTTRAAAWLAGSGTALGVDLSSPMLAIAERTAAAIGLPNAHFAHVDAQVHPFADDEFDVVLSRTGSMFFADPAAAFSNLARATKPGGRLVLLTWQPPPRNEWFTSFTTALAAGRQLPVPPPDAPGPFSQSDPDAVSRILVDAGFAAPTFEAQAEPMYFGLDVRTAERFVLGVLGWLLADLDDDARHQALDALRNDLAKHQTTDGIAYDSAAWLISSHLPG